MKAFICRRFVLSLVAIALLAFMSSDIKDVAAEISFIVAAVAGSNAYEKKGVIK